MKNGMTAIITMAGLGKRFHEAGYDLPKYRIMARGKTLFEWSMESLTGYRDHIINTVFVVRKEDCAKAFISEKCKELGISPINIVELEHVTDGQATSCVLALPCCEPNQPILIYNIDTYVEAGAMRYEDISGDGHIPCFKAEGDHWSFVRSDERGLAVEVTEKVRISDNCSLGAYYFSSAKLYHQIYEEYYGDATYKANTEKYVAPLYNLMIKKDMQVSISHIDAKKVHVLGTPEELAAFQNQNA